LHWCFWAQYSAANKDADAALYATAPAIAALAPGTAAADAAKVPANPKKYPAAADTSAAITSLL